MKRDNRARYTQRIAQNISKGQPARTIIHSKTQRPSPALIESSDAHWVHWKDTDGARRREWSTYGK